MRAIGALVLLVCVVYVTSQECPPPCPTATDCCLRPNGARDPGRCSPRLPRNARCRVTETEYQGGYLYDCPCESNLICNRGRCKLREPLRAPTRQATTGNDTSVVD